MIRIRLSVIALLIFSGAAFSLFAGGEAETAIPQMILENEIAKGERGAGSVSVQNTESASFFQEGQKDFFEGKGSGNVFTSVPASVTGIPSRLPPMTENTPPAPMEKKNFYALNISPSYGVFLDLASEVNGVSETPLYMTGTVGASWAPIPHLGLGLQGGVAYDILQTGYTSGSLFFDLEIDGYYLLQDSGLEGWYFGGAVGAFLIDGFLALRVEPRFGYILPFSQSIGGINVGAGYSFAIQSGSPGGINIFARYTFNL